MLPPRPKCIFKSLDAERKFSNSHYPEFHEPHHDFPSEPVLLNNALVALAARCGSVGYAKVSVH